MSKQQDTIREVPESGRPTEYKEPEALMSVQEFSATHPTVSRVLLAGFTHYCIERKMPPRLTAKQWHDALTTWQHAPVTV